MNANWRTSSCDANARIEDWVRACSTRSQMTLVNRKQPKSSSKFANRIPQLADCMRNADSALPAGAKRITPIPLKRPCSTHWSCNRNALVEIALFDNNVLAHDQAVGGHFFELGQDTGHVLI